MILALGRSTFEADGFRLFLRLAEGLRTPPSGSGGAGGGLFETKSCFNHSGLMDNCLNCSLSHSGVANGAKHGSKIRTNLRNMS